MSEGENKVPIPTAVKEFERRMAIEAEKIGVPVSELIYDYALEENADRAANPEEPEEIYKTGVASKTVERGITQTILARILAQRDSLTGLYNNQYLKEHFERRHRPEGQKGEFSVIMVDIDDFKKINDGLGHLAGDFILKEVSNVFKEKMRQGDLVVRVGGEEIMVIAPYANGDGPAFAERLRKAVEDRVFIYQNPEGVKSEIRVTISAGVAPFFEEGLDAMKQKSDEALYKAKGKRYTDEDTIEISAKKNQVWYFDKKDGQYKKFNSK